MVAPPALLARGVDEVVLCERAHVFSSCALALRVAHAALVRVVQAAGRDLVVFGHDLAQHLLVGRELGDVRLTDRCRRLGDSVGDEVGRDPVDAGGRRRPCRPTESADRDPRVAGGSVGDAFQRVGSDTVADRKVVSPELPSVIGASASLIRLTSGSRWATSVGMKSSWGTRASRITDLSGDETLEVVKQNGGVRYCRYRTAVGGPGASDGVARETAREDQWS